MYCEFYQLSERPFNVTPDPKFLYLNARYREAIASLNYGITQRKGFITLIGEAGTGKTTLLKRLLDDLDAKTKTVFIFNTNVTFEEILEYIFAEFDLPVHNGKKLYMLQRLNTFLLNELQGGGNVALLIDEAQDLEFSVLEDLRLLSNLETAKEKILQIVLSGQPELGQKLSNPILRQLRQRIGINCRLLPLSRDEISEYIRFRLQAAGCSDLKLFSRDAEDQIYHFSRGIPRLVNVVCDNALVIGYALGRKRIGADVIKEAAADLLSFESPVEETPVGEAVVAAAAPTLLHTGSTRWRARLGVMGVVMAAMVLGLLSVGRTMLQMRSEEPVPAPVVEFEVIRPGSQVSVGDRVDVVNPPEAEPQDWPLANDERGEEWLVQESDDDPAAVHELAGGDDEPDVGEERFADALAAKPAEGDGDRALLPAAAAKHDSSVPVAAGRARDASALVRVDPFDTLPGAAVATTSARVAPAPAIDEPPAAGNPRVVAGENSNPPVSEPRASADDEMDETELDAIAVAARASAVATKEPGLAAAKSREPRLDGVRFAEKVVRPGDSVSQIALQKYGQATHTILDMLKLANPELKDVDVISVGQTIRLPELGDGFPTLVEPSGRYALLVFSTPRLDQATNLQNALKGHGFDAGVSTGSFGSRHNTYRVVVSGFTNREQVAATGRQLQKVLRQDARIAKLGE